MDKKRAALAVVALAIGIGWYLLGVSGVFHETATPPGDVGLVSVAVTFVLLGIGGLMVAGTPERSA